MSDTKHDGTKLDLSLVSKARHACPACSRKGLGYAGHPHAFGFKDYNSVSCRYCRERWRISGSIFGDKAVIV